MEKYNEYGEIVKQPRHPAFYEHRIHETKDIFDSNCSYCQKAMQEKVKSYWSDDA